MSAKPKCSTLLPWLKANLGKHCLGPLTGTDAKALAAAVQTIELYAYHSEPEILGAFARIVRCMQPSTWELAYHAIAHVMDWTDRSRIWIAAGLPTFTPRKCEYES